MISRGDVRQRHAVGHPLRAVQMGREVAVAESEPRVALVPIKRLHRRPRLAREAPTAFGIDRAGERVGDGVEVGADVQTVQHDVVGGVDDRGHLGRFDDRQQTAQHAGCTHASR